MNFDPKIFVPIIVILFIIYFLYSGLIDRQSEKVKNRTGSFFSRIISKYTRGSPY